MSLGYSAWPLVDGREREREEGGGCHFNLRIIMTLYM